MNLANLTFQSIRFLLFPFALLYGFFVLLRNKLYDNNIYKSTTFNIPVLCVGNLSTGGTGKTPMVEYLLHILNNDFKTAILSRGYKRKTTGYALANEQSDALQIGDEPMQIYMKFPGTAVAVGEKRIEAIPQLLHDRPETQVIILDDGYQHRAIQCGFNILLTNYDDLFTKDFFLPTGNLRDEKRSYKRADIIVVTKCNPAISNKDVEEIIAEIRPLDHQQVFFSAIEYGIPYHILNPATVCHLNKQLEVLLVTGIANINPLKKYILSQTYTYEKLSFSDHHVFSYDDLVEIKQRFEKIDSNSKIILTTEKDAVRLVKFRHHLQNLPIYVLPVKHKILFNKENEFKNTITGFIKNFGKNKN